MTKPKKERPVNLLDDSDTLQQRIELAKEQAQRIVNGQIKSQRDAELVLRWVLSQRLGIGVFDPYFDKRTFEQLIFEAELHRAEAKPREENISEQINDHRKEISDALFSDWIEEDTQNMATKGMSDDEFMNTIGKGFSETGDFKV